MHGTTDCSAAMVSFKAGQAISTCFLEGLDHGSVTHPASCVFSIDRIPTVSKRKLYKPDRSEICGVPDECRFCVIGSFKFPERLEKWFLHLKSPIIAAGTCRAHSSVHIWQVTLLENEALEAHVS